MTRAELRRLFMRERARFARSYPWVAEVSLVLRNAPCSMRGHCKRRDLAFSDPDTQQIVIIRRLLEMPHANILGVLRHELGHMADEWIDDPGSEQRADDIVESVTGRKIRYDTMDVQTTGSGLYPRPRHLPV